MAQAPDPSGKKSPILGQGRSLQDAEADEIRGMIQFAQQSSRQLSIPAEDLHSEATTTMLPAVERVIADSGIRTLLEYFNRDFLYGLGRFDIYSQGLILKWGDGYSRRHIWVTVEAGNLKFETSHERICDQSFCIGGYHVYTPEQWHDINLMNAELAEQFNRPVYERSDD